MTKKEKPIEPKKGAPAYLVSFGDMMTLILCFFILLVSLSSTQDFGLTAKGIGSFITAVKSFGLSGILDAAEKQAIFEHQRRKFNLPPEEDPERRAETHQSASHYELITAKEVEALEPQFQVRQPQVAVFSAGSSQLSKDSYAWLDTVADTIRPRRGQILRLEGHVETPYGGELSRHSLAHERAGRVARYLIDKHGFDGSRVEIRTWWAEVTRDEAALRSVDARLITPALGP